MLVTLEALRTSVVKRQLYLQYNIKQILLSTPHGGFSETSINSTGNPKKKSTQVLSINNY